MTFSFCWKPRGAFPSGGLSVLSVLSTQHFSQQNREPAVRRSPYAVSKNAVSKDALSVQSVLSQHILENQVQSASYRVPEYFCKYILLI